MSANAPNEPRILSTRQRARFSSTYMKSYQIWPSKGTLRANRFTKCFNDAMMYKLHACQVVVELIVETVMN